MDETDKQFSQAEVPMELSGEDVRAHGIYLDQIGIQTSTDADYAESLREMSILSPIAAVKEAAHDLSRQPSEESGGDLKVALRPAEKNLAAEVSQRIHRADAARHGSQDEAVARTYNAINTYLHDATIDIYKLHLAFEGPQDADSYIDARLARSIPEVAEVIAKYLTAIDSDRRDFWPHQQTAEAAKQRDLMRGLTTDIRLLANDRTIEEFVASIYSLAVNRLRFWSQAKGHADEMRAVRERIISDKNRSIGGLAPSRLRFEADEPAVEEPPRVATPTNYEIPQSAKPEVETYLGDLRERDALVDRYVENGFLSRSAAEQRVFSGRPIRDEAGNVIGVEKDEESAPAIGRGVKSQKVHRRRSYKRYLSPRDTGPPQHIADEMRNDPSTG